MTSNWRSGSRRLTSERSTNARERHGELFTLDVDFAFLQGRMSRGSNTASSAAGRDRGVPRAVFEPYPNARLSQTVANARPIRPDVLITDVDFEIVGLPATRVRSGAGL